jgi:hypothetical protein
MSKITIIFTILSILLLTTQYSYAWNGYTHEWICEQIYRTNKELNKKLDHDQFIRGCTAPDVEFKDKSYHHCYAVRQCHFIDVSKIEPNSLTYFSDIKDCVGKSYFDCPALEKFEDSLINARKDNFSFYVGVSTHYFTDAHVPMHQIMGEDFFKCHAPFENDIDKELKEDKKSWTVSKNCEIYFPCEKTGKVSKKCDEKYDADIVYSYENIIDLIEKTDKTLSERLKLNYESDYSYLLKRNPTGFFGLIIDKIINFFRMIFG